MFFTFKKIFKNKQARHATLAEMEAQKQEMELELARLIAIEESLKSSKKATQHHNLT
ncbi:MAG: hypothetical protein AAF611_06685 [Bacteroidota bacterium]